MDTLKLGQLITHEATKDAVHMAVAPVVADEALSPGQHVGLFDAGTAGLVAREDAEHIGVVDPFLRGNVPQGARFWLFLYPGSITGLRHEWRHPAFADASQLSKTASEKWMRAWAVEHMGDDYYGGGEKLSEDVALAQAVRAGRDLHIGPYESARDSIDNEWWSHWEILTGEIGQRGEYFSCSC